MNPALQLITFVTGQLTTLMTSIFIWRYASCTLTRKHPVYVSLIAISLSELLAPFILRALSPEHMRYPLQLALRLVLLLLCMLFLWKDRWYKILLHTILGYSISLYAGNVVALISSLLVSIFLFSPENTVFADDSGQIMMSTGLILITLLTLTLICKRDKKKTIFSIATILVNLTLFFLILYYIDLNLHNEGIICFVLLIAYDVAAFLIHLFNRKKQQETAELETLQQKETDFVEYYKKILEQQESQGILIHDLKKHLNSIDILVKQGKVAEAEKYIHMIISSTELQENIRVCDNPFLNAILFRYKTICESSHVELHLDIRSECINYVSNNDLTALFCNLLDNAVEATSKQQNSIIELSVNKRERTPFTVITLHNTCGTNPFSEDGTELPSQKPQNSGHGFGIKSIKRIVQKYDGETQMYYDDNTSTFHTIITLKNPSTL